MSAHIPVLLDELVTWLEPARAGTFVDCTVGLGGHAAAVLAAGASRLLGLDRDPAALVEAAAALAGWADWVELVHADYRDLAPLLDARGLTTIAGVYADLGVSSLQLDTEGRGFSFRRDEPIDMRMDPTAGKTAADLLAHVDERELADLIFQFGEERHSRPIARALVRARERAPLETTRQVAEIVRRARPSRGWQRIDPATRTFQALRIWVNRELDGLDTFIERAAGRLAAGGRLAIITFHSLEDRIVKHTFRALERDGATVAGGGVPAGALGGSPLRVLTRRPVTPGDAELARNPRARSAKLRVLGREPPMSAERPPMKAESRR